MVYTRRKIQIFRRGSGKSYAVVSLPALFWNIWQSMGATNVLCEYSDNDNSIKLYPEKRIKSDDYERVTKDL
jgi:hypothetical protein